MLVCLANHLVIKVLIHCQRPVISLDQPQYQVEARKLFTVKSSIFGITCAIFPDSRQIHQCHKPPSNLKTKTQWFTGTGCHVADRRYLSGKQGIA
jgi:hypothetical protein